ncbi:MAG: hypothetical protein AAFN12_07990 [Cyanobacteria bacterium J06560_2]
MTSALQHTLLQQKKKAKEELKQQPSIETLHQARSPCNNSIHYQSQQHQSQQHQSQQHQSQQPGHLNYLE